MLSLKGLKFDNILYVVNFYSNGQLTEKEAIHITEHLIGRFGYDISNEEIKKGIKAFLLGELC